MQYIEELRLQECQNKLMELSEDEVNGYKSCRGKLSSLFTDCIEEYPIEMSFFICESFYPIATINNVLKEVDYPRYQFKWQYVAEIVINKIGSLNCSVKCKCIIGGILDNKIIKVKTIFCYVNLFTIYSILTP